MSKISHQCEKCRGRFEITNIVRIPERMFNPARIFSFRFKLISYEKFADNYYCVKCTYCSTEQVCPEIRMLGFIGFQYGRWVIGREFGLYGLEAFLEPKAIFGK